jgi:methylmalonyl-CoA mutase, N-terminal domain
VAVAAVAPQAGVRGGRVQGLSLDMAARGGGRLLAAGGRLELDGGAGVHALPDPHVGVDARLVERRLAERLHRHDAVVHLAGVEAHAPEEAHKLLGQIRGSKSNPHATQPTRSCHAKTPLRQPSNEGFDRADATIRGMATTEDRGTSADLSAWRRDRYDAVPERQGELFTTISGAENEPLSTRENVAIDYERDLGYPGEFPFTRGVYPSMYRGRLWTMRQFAGFGTAEETNDRFRYLLDHGQTGLSTAFDMPSLMGYDSDHPRSLGEVGREGVAIDSLEDMETLFAGIPLGEVSTSMTINSPAAILLAYYLCVGEEQGVPREALRGTIQTDILKEYIAQKEYIFPPEPSMRLVTDMVEFCARQMPLWHPISISGYHIREAGSTAAQELAFTLADGFTYVEWAIERGLDVDDFAPRLSFFFNAHLDFFEEIAKYRAGRRIWARELRERYGAKNPRSWLMRFHTQTAGVSLTAQQPEVNIVRTALEALAAVLGGTQSLHTNSFDEALALPTEDAVRLALRTQQVIAHETGVVSAIDPLGGSYHVEAQTNRLEREAYEYFDRIEKLGGVVEAIKENFFQREIAEASFRYQQEVERGERVVVGVNRYLRADEPPIPLLKIDPALERKQIERVQALRARRDSQAAESALATLKAAAARDDVNLMPPIIDAARAYVTMGEMCDAFREVWGVWRETPVF